MRILVYGAGNIGRLYAARLKESGQDVVLLARGARLTELRTHGIQLENVVTGVQTRVHVTSVERLDPDDGYDLVLVPLPEHHVSEVLPILAANRQTRSVMFFGNNSRGAQEMIEALGRDRVLLGFPGAAAVDRDGWLHYLITSAREQPTTIGELDGTRSARIEAIRDALRSAGFSAAICSNMDAWLKTHVAKISPMANALYMAGGDPVRLARTRDALLLMLRAIREGFRVLDALGVPITPANHRIFQWLPEPLLLLVLRRMFQSETMTIKVGHAQDARREMKSIADGFRALARSTSSPTPAMDRLYAHLDPSEEPVADGSSEAALNWSGVWILGVVLAVVVLLTAMVSRGIGAGW